MHRTGLSHVQITIDDNDLPSELQSELLNNTSLWPRSDSFSSYNCTDPSPRQEVNADEVNCCPARCMLTVVYDQANRQSESAAAVVLIIASRSTVLPAVTL